MASRDGATVAGTDGSDFNHRESIASQYKVRYVTQTVKLIFKTISRKDHYEFFENFNMSK